VPLSPPGKVVTRMLLRARDALSTRRGVLATRECELLDRERFRTPAEARRALFD